MNIKRFGVIAALATALSITGAGIAVAATSNGESKPPTPSVDKENIAVTGKLISGVENGCSLLRTKSGAEYQLFTDDPSVHIPENNSIVTYIGHVDQNTASFCGQGTPFRVVKVTTA